MKKLFVGRAVSKTRLVLKTALEEPAKSPVFLLNSRMLFPKLKFWKSLGIITILLFGFASCSTVNNSAKNNLNWDGLYTGTLPGANSDIYTEIILNKDSTYKVTYRYIDKSEEDFSYTGTFLWKNNNTIDLNKYGVPSLYIVGENSLTQLDKEGNKTTGAFADMYVLKKKQ